MIRRLALTFAACAAVGLPGALAVEPTTEPSDSGYVSRAEYDQLKKEHDEMRAELNELKKDKTQTASDAQEEQQEIEDRLKVVEDGLEHTRSGFENVTIVGDMSVDFTTQRKNASSFGVTVSPLILWQLNDHVLVETAFDLDTGNTFDENGTQSSSDTTIALTQGNVSYIVDDYLMVGGGLFIVPFNSYHNHFDPPWIYKFPDDPLSAALTPDSEVGVFARGAAPVGPTKLTYDFYAVNGPQLNTDTSNGPVGSLNYSDFTDQNNNKGIGGRIGWLPTPYIEMGSSIELAKANPIGFEPVRTVLYGLDLNVNKDIDPLEGRVQFRTEWVWSNVERATYDPDGSIGFGPLSFSNYSDAATVELSYRPTLMAAPIKNFEIVSRYDLLNTPIVDTGPVDGVEGNHIQRYTVGLDYWFEPNVVLKAAYEIYRSRIPPRENAFLLQLGVGL